MAMGASPTFLTDPVLRSVTDPPSTAPPSTSGSTAASACSTCCGEHGTPDPSDPSDKELCARGLAMPS
eukprot:s3001_g10.t1